MANWGRSNPLLILVFMAFPPSISGPVALYNNLPINANFYEPNVFFISAIANGVTTTVTTTANHNYVIGQQCRLLVLESNKGYQFNGLSGYVLSIPTPTSVVLNINSTGFDTFVTSSSTTQPQIAAIGDINTGLLNSLLMSNTNAFIPGSFINISPG